MKDKRVGEYLEDGSTRWPDTTLSGHAYEFPPHTVTGLGGPFFIVQDTWAPRDFDVQAAIDELRLKVSAVTPPDAPIPSGESNLADTANSAAKSVAALGDALAESGAAAKGKK